MIEHDADWIADCEKEREREREAVFCFARMRHSIGSCVCVVLGSSSDATNCRFKNLTKAGLPRPCVRELIYTSAGNRFALIIDLGYCLTPFEL